MKINVSLPVDTVARTVPYFHQHKNRQPNWRSNHWQNSLWSSSRSSSNSYKSGAHYAECHPLHNVQRNYCRSLDFQPWIQVRLAHSLGCQIHRTDSDRCCGHHSISTDRSLWQNFRPVCKCQIARCRARYCLQYGRAWRPIRKLVQHFHVTLYQHQR